MGIAITITVTGLLAVGAWCLYWLAFRAGELYDEPDPDDGEPWRNEEPYHGLH
jgi:hypothetical protein